ncbi:MAG: adenylate synthase, partial [Bacteroidia bacterium]
IEICKAQKHRLINIKPTQIISFAEVLTPELKQGLIQTFKVPVKEVYQCTEGFLGVTCTHGTMHLNEDIIYIEKEWVNTEHTMFMPIVTDFTRSTQPIVRYRLNDVLEINSLPCPCGLPFTSIKQIIGRSDDVLHINNRTLNPDIISRAIALQTDAFIAYTITQRGKHKLIVTIDAPSNIFPKLCSVIQITLQQLIQIHCQTNTIDIEFVADKVVQMGEKWRTVKRIVYEN